MRTSHIMDIKTKQCTVREKDSEFSYKYYKVTKENISDLRNNASILKYAPNRPRDYKIGDYIVIMKSPSTREINYHAPKKVFEENYIKTNLGINFHLWKKRLTYFLFSGR